MSEEAIHPGSDDPMAQGDKEGEESTEELSMVDELKKLDFEVTSSSDNGSDRWLASKELNGHQINISFKHREAYGFDAKITLDNNNVAKSNDLSRYSLLAYVDEAISMANQM